MLLNLVPLNRPYNFACGFHLLLGWPLAVDLTVVVHLLCEHRSKVPSPVFYSYFLLDPLPLPLSLLSRLTFTPWRTHRVCIPYPTPNVERASWEMSDTMMRRIVPVRKLASD